MPEFAVPNDANHSSKRPGIQTSCLDRSWASYDYARSHKGNASQEIDCENKQPDRACLLAGLLREFTRSLRRLHVGANSQLFQSQSKNVTKM